MTLPASAGAPAPKKRGPKTPEGKARSATNAVRHGLRARTFALLPEEDPAEWALHLADLRRDLAPDDPTEDKLVTALAVAMWKEIRADRAEAGVLARMAADGAHGRDLGEPRQALSLGTAIRYATAAGMATMRAQRAFLAHRKAKQKGLILPVAAASECTNEFAAAAREPETPNRTNGSSPPTPVAAPAALGAPRTNDFPHSLAPQPAASAPAAASNRRERRRLEALARHATRRAA